MQKFTKHSGVVAPLDRDNVDTDIIIPKQFLKSIKRSGFGKNLFDQLRYLDEGKPDESCVGRPLDTTFVLNRPTFAEASILLTRHNFGCGSSREHAPWALYDFGFRVIIATSFADIFFNNCVKNGLLLITLSQDVVNELFAAVYAAEAAQQAFMLTVDLASQTIVAAGGKTIGFEIDDFRKRCLLEGLDEIALTLLHAERIKKYEQAVQQQKPWLLA